MRSSFAIALALGVTAALAQPADDGEWLDEVIVSAARLPASVGRLPRSVSVISKDDVQLARQQLGLDEALKGVPGLYLQNRYNFAQDLRVSLRGFGARSSFGIRGVKVVVDGIPQTLPDGQAGVDNIDLGSIGRIEVLRGPASVQYGNAAGGVIAIESESAITPFFAAQLAAGEAGYQKVQLKSAGQRGRADYLASVSHQRIEGYREQSAAENSLINARYRYAVTDSDQLTVTFNHTDQPIADDPGGVTFEQASTDRRGARDRNLSFNAGEALDQQQLGLVYRSQRDASEWSVRNYYSQREFANRLPFSNGGIVELDRFFVGVGTDYAVDFSPGSQLLLGAQAQRQRDDRQRFDNLAGQRGDRVFDQDETVKNLAAYLQGARELGRGWGATAGLRFDQVDFDVDDRYLVDGDDSGEVDFDEMSASLGLSRALGSGIAFVNLSTSFETPTTTEFANPDGSGGFNQDLAAQEATNVELGWKGQLANHSFDIAAFQIGLDDELVPFELEAFPGRTFFANAGESTRRGLEAAYRWSGERLGLTASYTYSDFEFDSFVDANGNNFAGRQQPGTPEHFGQLGVSYRNERGWLANLDAYYSGALFADNANAVEVDDYWVTDFRLSKALGAVRWQMRPYLGINNLFNQRYNSNIRPNAFGRRYFEPAPERNVYLGLTLRYE